MFPVISVDLRNPTPEIAFASDADIYPEQLEQTKKFLYSDVQRGLDTIKDCIKCHDTIRAEAENIFRQPQISFAGGARPVEVSLKQTIECTFSRYGTNPNQKKGHHFKLGDKLQKVVNRLISKIDETAPPMPLQMNHDQWLNSNLKFLTTAEKDDLANSKTQYGY